LFCGQWSWEVIDCFVDIGRIDYLHCLNFLFIIFGRIISVLLSSKMSMEYWRCVKCKTVNAFMVGTASIRKYKEELFVFFSKHHESVSTTTLVICMMLILDFSDIDSRFSVCDHSVCNWV
jgi:hypothetical protein